MVHIQRLPPLLVWPAAATTSATSSARSRDPPVAVGIKSRLPQESFPRGLCQPPAVACCEVSARRGQQCRYRSRPTSTKSSIRRTNHDQYPSHQSVYDATEPHHSKSPQPTPPSTAARPQRCALAAACTPQPAVALARICHACTSTGCAAHIAGSGATGSAFDRGGGFSSGTYRVTAAIAPALRWSRPRRQRQAASYILQTCQTVDSGTSPVATCTACAPTAR